MKVAILAGGFGTRLSEYTDLIPKPMVPIGGKPIIAHIMTNYARYGHNDFYVALGYKAEIIKQYFLNYRELNSNFSINLASGLINQYESDISDWNVHLINTGDKSMTGGRLKRLRNFLGNETFMATYGDGLANINLNELLSFHRSHGKLVTVTAVRPSARFGGLTIDGDSVLSFKEKPQAGEGWVNGGFFVMEPKFLDFIDGDETLLEKEPLERAAKEGQLMAFRHEGFWQCMDTKRDHDLLEMLWESSSPWVV